MGKKGCFSFIFTLKIGAKTRILVLTTKMFNHGTRGIPIDIGNENIKNACVFYIWVSLSEK